MHVDRPEPGARRNVVVLWTAVVVAAACSAAALASSGATQPLELKLGGTWSGSYTGAYNGTFTLRWTQTGSTLKGTIALSSPHGTYGITGGIRGSAIKFGAVGVGAVYTARS